MNYAYNLGQLIKIAAELPYRKRVEVLIHDGKGNILCGKYPNGSYGFFGGGVDDGEDYETAAAREAQEESGYSVTDVKKLAQPVYTQDWDDSYKEKLRREGKSDRADEFKGSTTCWAIAEADTKGAKAKNKEDRKVKFKEIEFRPYNDVLSNLAKYKDKGKEGLLIKARYDAVSDSQSAILKGKDTEMKSAAYQIGALIKHAYTELDASKVEDLSAMLGAAQSVAPVVTGGIGAGIGALLGKKGKRSRSAARGALIGGALNTPGGIIGSAAGTIGNAHLTGKLKDAKTVEERDKLIPGISILAGGLPMGAGGLVAGAGIGSALTSNLSHKPYGAVMGGLAGAGLLGYSGYRLAKMIARKAAPEFDAKGKRIED